MVLLILFACIRLAFAHRSRLDGDSEDEDAAQAMGLDTRRLKLLALP
ncbi:hypothetical protein [Pseudomonas chlororaphis]|nr:hypothetical protein [Pseudomonas chlororaphis]